MTRPKSVVEKSRLTLEIPVKVREQMDKIRHMTGAESVTEVIRRAVALYATITEMSLGKQMRVVMRDKNGEETNILLPNEYYLNATDHVWTRGGHSAPNIAIYPDWLCERCGAFIPGTDTAVEPTPWAEVGGSQIPPFDDESAPMMTCNEVLVYRVMAS